MSDTEATEPTVTDEFRKAADIEAETPISAGRVRPSTVKVDVENAFDHWAVCSDESRLAEVSQARVRVNAFLAQVEADRNKQGRLELALENLIRAVKRWADDPEYLERAMKHGTKVLED